MRRPVRNVFLLGLLIGLVIALVRALRAAGSGPGAVGSGAPSLPDRVPVGAPQEDRVTATSVVAPSPERPTSTPASPPEDSPSAGSSPGAVPAEPPPAAPSDPSEPPEDVVAPVVVDPVPDVAATADPQAGTEASTWEAPVDGDCPPGFPVKAKEGSRIFHVPEGAFYARTVADRCYPTAAAAEADGFRRSKR